MWKVKNAAFVNISSSRHLMLLFIASACPLTISLMGKLFKVVGSRTLKIQQKFHVLFVDRIVVGEIPVFWLIRLTEKSFSSSKSAMYARYSSLKRRVKTMPGKWISQTFLDWPLQSSKTYQLVFLAINASVFLSFCINYLLFFEMYYIYKEQAYLAALKAANRLSQSITILDKNYLRKFSPSCPLSYATKLFRTRRLCGKKTPSPDSMLLPTNPQGSGFLLNTQQHCFLGEGGEGRTGTATMFRKMLSKYTIFSTVLSKIVYKVLRVFLARIFARTKTKTC